MPIFRILVEYLVFYLFAYFQILDEVGGVFGYLSKTPPMIRRIIVF